MGLIDQARADIKDITSNSNDFGVSGEFIAPSGDVAVCNCIHTKHYMAFTAEGEMINSKKASIAVAESSLTDLNYPTRNTTGEVHFEFHKVNIADSTGIVKNYIASEWFPDENVGLIVLILGDFE